MYPEYNQMDPDNRSARRSPHIRLRPIVSTVEKLFSERLFLAYQRQLWVQVRIARFHNIFGPEGTWQGARRKAPAALCRKVASTPDGVRIEIWGDGKQTRSLPLHRRVPRGSAAPLLESEFTDR